EEAAPPAGVVNCTDWSVQYREPALAGQAPSTGLTRARTGTMVGIRTETNRRAWESIDDDEPRRFLGPPAARRARNPAGRLRGPGRARRQHGKRVWLHAAVRRTPGALRKASRPGFRRTRLSVQPVRRAGTRRRRRDRGDLPASLRRRLPVVREGRGQRSASAPGVPVVDPRAARRVRATD